MKPKLKIGKTSKEIFGCIIQLKDTILSRECLICDDYYNGRCKSIFTGEPVYVDDDGKYHDTDGLQ
jgi:hypothetical protein